MPGPLEASSAVEEQPGGVALHVLGGDPRERQEGPEQALEAGLYADQLGRWPVAEPGRLLLDVTDQLPGVGGELLADRVGGVDQHPKGRKQAAVDADVEQQCEGAAVGGQLALAFGRRGLRRATAGRPARSDPVVVGLGDRVEP